MSVIIISGGGDGHNSINKLVTASPNMSPIQLAQAEALIKKFAEDVEALIATVKSP